jgi:hypothetical protein
MLSPKLIGFCMLSPKLIGFCGVAGAGKSFAAVHLVRNHGFSRLRFAGPLKDMMRALGLNESEIEGADKERPSDLLGGKTPRHAMQTIGTEWGRELIDPDLWTRAWGRAADNALAAGQSIVVDDVRFSNEAAAIWARGGSLVRLFREGAGSSSGGAHASENQAFPFDLQLINPGEPAAFIHTLNAMLE